MRRLLAALGGLIVFAIAAGAQPWFSDVFPPEEYAARRARVMAQIGDGIAVLQGAAERPAEAPFRQNNQFFYLTGVEVPRAILILDGRAKTSTLYLADNSRRARAWGPLLEAGDEAVRITGADAAVKRDEAEVAIARAGSGKRPIYTALRPEVLGSGSAGDAAAWQRATASDPWDGRPSREQVFVEKLKQKAPGSEIRDLDPLLDAMRFIKSSREIAVVKEVTRSWRRPPSPIPGSGKPPSVSSIATAAATRPAWGTRSAWKSTTSAATATRFSPGRCSRSNRRCRFRSSASPCGSRTRWSSPRRVSKTCRRSCLSTSRRWRS